MSIVAVSVSPPVARAAASAIWLMNLSPFLTAAKFYALGTSTKRRRVHSHAHCGGPRHPRIVAADTETSTPQLGVDRPHSTECAGGQGMPDRHRL